MLLDDFIITAYCLIDETLKNFPDSKTPTKRI